jgi:hypothetical protein
MAKLGAPQLEAAFRGSQSGKGFRLEGVDQLRDFAGYTRTRGAVVCNVETFEFRGEWEVARIDLSIYQGDAEHQALPINQRMALADETLREIFADIEREGIGCVFQVWADEL